MSSINMNNIIRPYSHVPGASAGRGEDPLECLAALDLLSVGPVRVEKRRLICPYRIVQHDSEDTFNLIYRWEEDVFDPNDEVDRNLAAMIAAQVALNYGLFADEIRFNGPFDGNDREFLSAMADNTATEIYVKRFLEDNPFIIGKAASLPAIKRPSYLRSRLSFPQGLSKGFANYSRDRERHPDPSRHAVLSSGGKDSLLTFGILAELGQEVHPVFINESGRHWFTALNAYRHFRDHVGHTSRVWTNADRLFVWMKRHFSFIRPDFARLRADEYPIRLWTVAVFLIGALPLVRKRGIGRISIGDEFDTTRFADRCGIPHFDGLFDQSLVFDRVLSDYYRLKGWGIEQFLILRPMSEFLIQKVLAARFPDLLTHQVSCHAAHITDGRVRPCGRCEKCRRIVGMLTAFGADPAALGYTQRQIEQCLTAVDRAGVYQESEGAQHLYYLLRERRRISGDSHICRPRPEVERLRFDPAASPPDAVPNDLRDRLYTILTRYAEAVIWDGSRWVRWDVTDGWAPDTSARDVPAAPSP